MKDSLRRVIKKEQSIRAYEDNDFLIIIPLTFEAMYIYGYGARWCTTSEEEMFNAYSPLDNPFFIIIDRNSRRLVEGQYYQEKYLLQFETSGIYDVDNLCVPYNTFFYDYPQLKDVFLEIVLEERYKKYNYSEFICILGDLQSTHLL